LTLCELFNIAGSTPADFNSSGEKEEMDSTPFRRFCQNSVTFLAPGKRPLMPTMAILSGHSLASELLIGLGPPVHSLLPENSSFSLLVSAVLELLEWRSLAIFLAQFLG